MSQIQVARLIIPQGETISPPPDLYEAILKMLRERETTPKISRAELVALIEETRGKYAGERSLVEALLAERAIERAREMRRDEEKAKQFFKKR